VRLELALPPAGGVLQREQPFRAEFDGSVERRQLLDDSHAATLVVTSDNNLAAVRPERTALSIVAGQPVAVHAPARVTSGRSVHGPGRNAAVPGRSATVAFGSRLTRDQSSSAWPSRSVTCPAIRSTSSRPRTSISSGTPLETTVKYCASAGHGGTSRFPRTPSPGPLSRTGAFFDGLTPVKALRSKTQCASESRSAASGVRRSGLSNRRCTQRSGDGSSFG